MYFRGFPEILIFLAVLVGAVSAPALRFMERFFPASLGGGPSSEGAYAQYPVIFDRVSRSLDGLSDPADKIKAVQRGISELQELRLQVKTGSIDQEVEMDLTIEALRLLPEPKAFKISQCPSIKNNVILQFEPTAGGPPQNPPVRRAWDIIAKICG